MIWLFISVGLFIIIALFGNNEPKKISKPTREEIEVNLKDYTGHYSFNVKGVHLQDFLYPVLNHCKVLDLITLVPEPENKFDSDAIMVMNSNWHIGYVPAEETFEIHQIIKKEHIAYIETRDIDGYINVSIKIRYKE